VLHRGMWWRCSRWRCCKMLLFKFSWQRHGTHTKTSLDRSQAMLVEMHLELHSLVALTRVAHDYAFGG